MSSLISRQPTIKLKMAKISCFVGLINFNQISIIYYNNETRHTSFGHTHHITTEIPIYIQSTFNLWICSLNSQLDKKKRKIVKCDCQERVMQRKQ